MYVKSVEEKVLAALASQSPLPHSAISGNLTHQESIGLLDTVREMQRVGLLRRELIRNEAGKLVLHYVRVG